MYLYLIIKFQTSVNNFTLQFHTKKLNLLTFSLISNIQNHLLYAALFKSDSNYLEDYMIYQTINILYQQLNRMNSMIDLSSSKEKGKTQVKIRTVKKRITHLSRRKLRKMIRKKIQNEKMVKTLQKKLIKLRFLSLCVKQQQYNCPICLQLLIYPTTLQCGHAFCLPCVENFKKTIVKNQCSICRADNLIKFHQIDPNVKRIVQFIHKYKLAQFQQSDYLSRKKSLGKQFKQRGIKGFLRLNDQIKIKVNNFWVKGRVITVYQKGENIYYEIFTIFSEEKHFISKKSINIKQQQVQKVQKAKRATNCIFSQNIFLEDQIPRRQTDNTYNIQQLLWEVNYYEPQQASHSFWSQQYPNRLFSSGAEQQQREENDQARNLAVPSTDY